MLAEAGPLEEIGPPELGPPGATDRPLLTAARQGSRRLVMATDARAAALGIRPGMAVAHAQAMLPDLRIEQADQAADQAALERLAIWCLRHFSPLASPCPPDGIWIDVTGCTHIFAPPGCSGQDPAAGEPALLAELTGRLARAGIAARAAIADTPGAAHALARFASRPVTVAPSGTAMQALADLPVAGLRLPEETVQALRLLGFDTIGQLYAAPRAPLARRFGNQVLHRLDQATGDAPEPIEPVAAPDRPRTRMGFPEPIATPEDLARATALLAERLCEKLRRAGQGASRLDLLFQRIDGVAQIIRIGTTAPSRDAPHLTRLLQERIQTIDPGFGIDSMMLSACLTARLDARQDLSELCTVAHAPDLSSLIDTLLNRLGVDRIYRVQPVESDVPERSLRRVAPQSRGEGSCWPDRLPRPPRLFTPPRPVETIALLPDHAPMQFTWRRRPHRIRRADGPERIYGEWWKDAQETWAVRDYFQVEDDAGQRFWLFRSGDGVCADTGDLQWFLHGVFA
jgi:protein ImuB